MNSLAGHGRRLDREPDNPGASTPGTLAVTESSRRRCVRPVACTTRTVARRRTGSPSAREGSPDDLSDCYLASAQVLALAREQMPGCKALADYTGGTKSMSAGLAALALDDGQCELSVVIGNRVDLVKVANLTEFARRLSVSDTQIHRRLQAAREFTARYDYAAAEQLLRNAAADLPSSSHLQRLQRGINLCRCFDEWDRFEHKTALSCLEAYRREFAQHGRVLEALCGGKAHGFEWVEDLLLNAERRSAWSQIAWAFSPLW